MRNAPECVNLKGYYEDPGALACLYSIIEGEHSSSKYLPEALEAHTACCWNQIVDDFGVLAVHSPHVILVPDEHKRIHGEDDQRRDRIALVFFNDLPHSSIERSTSHFDMKVLINHFFRYLLLNGRLVKLKWSLKQGRRRWLHCRCNLRILNGTGHANNRNMPRSHIHLVTIIWHLRIHTLPWHGRHVICHFDRRLILQCCPTSTIGVWKPVVLIALVYWWKP